MPAVEGCQLQLGKKQVGTPAQVGTLATERTLAATRGKVNNSKVIRNSKKAVTKELQRKSKKQGPEM
jgi:hypothetical protein